MAKGKIPLPRTKTKMGFGDKFWGGIAGLSTLIKHPNLYRSLSGGSELGARRLAKLKAARIAKYGKWGARGMGLFNPWTAVPVGLMGLAQYGVGKAFDPYRDETGKIGAEGHERLLQERLAREDLAARRNLAREEGVGFWERAQMKRDGGLAGLL